MIAHEHDNGKQRVAMLLIYDYPTIVEFVGFPWLQRIAASYVAWKVGRKIRRYNERMDRLSKGRT